MKRKYRMEDDINPLVVLIVLAIIGGIGYAIWHYTKTKENMVTAYVGGENISEEGFSVKVGSSEEQFIEST